MTFALNLVVYRYSLHYLILIVDISNGVRRTYLGHGVDDFLHLMFTIYTLQFGI